MARRAPKQLMRHQMPKDPYQRLAMMPLWKQCMTWLTYGAFRVLVAALERATPGQIYGLAGMFGGLFWRISKRHRQIACRNLEIAFGNKYTEGERLKIGAASVRHFLYTLADTIIVPRLVRRGDLDSFLENPEVFDELREIEDSDQPGVIHTGHIGSWEVGGTATCLAGYSLNIVYRPLDHPLIDKWIADTRSLLGNRLFPRWGALQGYRETLKSNGWLAVIADQNGGDYAAFLDFFGQPASTEVSYFPLFKRYKADIVFMAFLRVGEVFRFRLLGPWRADVRYNANAREESMRLGQWYMDCIQRAICEAPEQYLWVHRRYKARPSPEVASLYSDLAKPLSEAVLAAQPKPPILPIKWKLEAEAKAQKAAESERVQCGKNS